MSAIRELFIKLGLDVDGASFAEGLAFEKALEKGAELVVDAFKELGHVFVEAVVKTGEYAEGVINLGAATGFSAQAVQELGHAAEASGSSAEEMRSGLTHLARQLEAARSGSADAQKAFTGMGISMGQLKGKTPEQVLNLVSEQMKALGPGTKRTALAFDLFGRSGGKIIPVIGEGIEKLEEFRQTQIRSGNVMSEDQLKAAADLDDQFDQMKLNLEGVQHELGVLLSKYLSPLLKRLQVWWEANRQLISQKLERVVGVVTGAIETLIPYVTAAGSALVFLSENLALLPAAIAAVTAAASMFGAVSLAAGLKAAIGFIAGAAPIAILAALLLFAGLAVDDFIGYLNGADSVFGEFAPKWAKWLDEFLMPAAGEWWVVTFIKMAIRNVTDLYGKVAPLLDLIESIPTPGDKGREFAIRDAQHRATADYERQWGTGATTGVMAPVFGNASSPGASAAAASTGAAGGSIGVLRPTTFNAPITINAAPGMDPGAISDQVTLKVYEVWNTKMREGGGG